MPTYKKRSKWWRRTGTTSAQIYYIRMAKFLVVSGEYNRIYPLYYYVIENPNMWMPPEVEALYASVYYRKEKDFIKREFNEIRSDFAKAWTDFEQYCKVVGVDCPPHRDNEFYKLALTRNDESGFRKAMYGRIETKYQQAADPNKAVIYSAEKMISDWRSRKRH
ncbi:hypothetical protein IKF25_03410 [Candidatus Saccharibacteria bacterium]|nr:hypothetical protein [Candidatus Saccharibacteria bacterium]